MRYAFVVALIPLFMPAPLAALVAPVIAGAKALGGVALRGLAGRAAQTGLGAAAKEGAKGAAAKEGAKGAAKGGMKEGSKAAKEGVDRAKLMDFARDAGQQHMQRQQMEQQKQQKHLDSTRQAAERSRGGTTSGFGQ